MNDDKLCLLLIATYEDDPTDNNPTGNIKTRLRYHFYTYHLNENGVIGRMYDSEYGVIENAIYTEDITDNYYRRIRVGSSNLRYDKFAISYLYKNGSNLRNYIKILNINTIVVTDETINILISLSNSSEDLYISGYGDTYDYSYNLSRVYFTANDDYVYTQGYSGRVPVAHLDDNYNIDVTTGYRKQTSSTGADGGDGEDIIIPYPEKNIAIYIDHFANKFIIMTINSDKSFSISKTITYNNDIGYSCVVHAEIDPENEKLILYFVNGSHVYDATETSMEVIDISGIENWEDGLNIKGSDKILQSEIYSVLNGLKWYAANQNKSLIFSNGSSRFFRSEVATDLENIVGIIYNGDKYYRIKSGDLSAGGPDVRSGKTFIGYLGEIETGTMGV